MKFCLIIAFSALNFLQRISRKNNWKGVLVQVFTEEKHKVYCRNFDGKSGAMEAEAATRIWGKSEKVNKMRYETFIGDETHQLNLLSQN